MNSKTFAMNSLTSNPVADAPNNQSLQEDISAIREGSDHLIMERGKFELFLFRKQQAPTLFFELCRQRELTFRLAGQGTGASFDETPEDEYYDQLVIWDREKERLAGAYRLAQTSEVIPERGQDALYLNHMFDFDEAFFNRDLVSLELTRSFIAPDYQNDRLALPLLWQGLGKTLHRLNATLFFGSVTMAADFSEKSRALIVSWLTQYRTYQPKSLAVAHQKFPGETTPGCDLERNIDELKPQIVDHEGNPKPIPPLLRHYLKLGAVFHAYHIEPSFNDALYCLLEVDFNKVPPSHQKRFLQP